ncbi:MAG: hypothetical protein KDA64_18285 [Rhodospirillaceae bacterium]|nr:hypothetical protein [Rhodospirillaceae bacterium]
MIGPVSTQGVALSLPKAGGSQTAAPRSADGPPESVARTLEALQQLDPETADVLKQSLNAAQDALEQLDAARQQMAEQRKAAAEERLRQIHEKLKTLRLFATMDPKATVRLATQWSRELAWATKDYAEANDMANTPSSLGSALAAAAGDSEAEPLSTASSFAEIKARYEAALREQVLGDVTPFLQALPLTREHAEFAFNVRSIEITLKATVDGARWMLGDKLDYATGRNVKSAKTAWRQVEHHLRELSQPRRTSAFGGVNLRA